MCNEQNNQYRVKHVILFQDLLPDLTLLNINMTKKSTYALLFPANKIVLSKIICTFAALEPAKPLNDAQMCGSFLYIRIMATTIPFGKVYTNPQDLVSLLISRGLSIHNKAKAERYLAHIGYYRLSVYTMVR